MIEYYNHLIFLAINASPGLHGWPLALAIDAAEWFIFSIPVVLVQIWFSGNQNKRRAAILSTMAAGVALLLNQAMGLAWFHPRPFMEGIGHTYLVHAAENSFPSDHGAVVFAVALGLLSQADTRKAGWFMTLLAVVVVWSRIYVGVHYPLDMLGALAAAVLSVVLMFSALGRKVTTIGLNCAEVVSLRVFRS